MKNPVSFLKRIYASINKTSQAVDDLNFGLAEIKVELAKLKDGQEELNKKVDRLDKIEEMYFEALYRRSGEDAALARKRFFTDLPKATGALKVIQEGQKKLLKEFDAFCRKNGLIYWIDGGTLLGAVRHGGFVPWDDDVDVYMSRDDIKRMQELLKGDDKYRVTTVYSTWNANKEVRFRTTDVDNPCFIDLFIFDYGMKYGDDEWAKWHEEKAEFIKKLNSMDDGKVKKWREKMNISVETAPELVKTAEKVFDEFYGGIDKPVIEGTAGGVVSKLEGKKPVSIIWALDNLCPIAHPENSRIYKYESIFPLKEISFEGIKVFAPKEKEKYLEDLYGDIYRIPQDLVSHFQHTKRDKETLDPIKRYISE